MAQAAKQSISTELARDHFAKMSLDEIVAWIKLTREHVRIEQANLQQALEVAGERVGQIQQDLEPVAGIDTGHDDTVPLVPRAPVPRLVQLQRAADRSRDRDNTIRTPVPQATQASLSDDLNCMIPTHFPPLYLAVVSAFARGFGGSIPELVRFIRHELPQELRDLSNSALRSRVSRLLKRYPDRFTQLHAGSFVYNGAPQPPNA